MYQITKGATSQSVDVFIQDSTSTTGGGKTGLVFNTASLTAYYRRGTTGTPTAITLATLANAQAAWSSGGFVEIDSTNEPGMYRLDIPDAALASGADRATVFLKGAAGMVPRPIGIRLLGADLQDTVRLGLAALPNAAAETTGGVHGQVVFAATSSLQSQAGMTTSQFKGASTDSTDDNGRPGLVWKSTGGTGPNQIRNITSYVGSTKVYAFDTALTTQPDSTTTYQILDVGGHVIASDITVSGGQVGVYTIAADAVNASALASDAAQEIADALLDRADGIETSNTLRQALRLILAAATGVSDLGNKRFYAPDNSTVRISATVDGSNNRTAVTRTP